MSEHQATPPALTIDAIPELETRIGMVGAMTQVEVGGQVCLEAGILVIGGGA